VTYPEFDACWKQSGGAERANYGLFLHELCALIGVPAPDPTTDNPAEDAYVLERAVTFLDSITGPTPKTSTGRIDLYKRGCFVLETKQGTDTPDQQKKADLLELGLPPEKRRKGHALRGTPKWEQMMQAARVTRELAGYLAGVSAQLERAGHPADVVAQFLMRYLFTMFSEDSDLIPKTAFTGMLRQYSTPELLPFLPNVLQNLWERMDKGGFSSELKANLMQFNGKLFHDATALPPI